MLAEENSSSNTSTNTNSQATDIGSLTATGETQSASEGGIGKGILHRGVTSGALSNKKIFDMPYQVNTISQETLENQGVHTFDEAVKYFPSAQLQYRGGADQGRPQTRGFQGSVVGNHFWDGFYSVSTTAIPMFMFESLQIQNGLAGSLYGGQEPSGNFSYTRKRPRENYNATQVDYTSYGHIGLGLDTSNKFKYVGYRGVFYTASGNREPVGNEISRQLASVGLDFYPLDNLTIEMNASYYKHIGYRYYGSASVRSTNGIAQGEIPSMGSVTQNPITNTNGFNDRFMETTTASAKVKYAPLESLYFEGGYQWQRALRSRTSRGSQFTIPSGFIKAQGAFDTAFIKHNITLSANAYEWMVGKVNSGDSMKNVGLLYDVGLGRYFEVILSGANSWFKSDDYNKSGISWAGSAIVKIIPDNLNVYFTYADSLKSGTIHSYDSNNGYDTNHPLYGTVITFAPYRSEQFEIGIKGKIADLDISAAVFQITRPLYYESDRTTNGGTNTTQGGVFENQGDQRNRGIELTLGGKIIESLSVFGGVAILDAKMHKALIKPQVEGKIIRGEPLVQSNVLFDFVVPSLEQLAFSANFHYTGKRWVDEMNTKSVDDYFTMDLGVRYTTELASKQATVRFNVNNLFNAQYWAGMFPGSLDGNPTSGSSTSLFRGYDRTFMLSAHLKF